MHIEAIWNLMTTNYAYIQKDKTAEDLAALLDIWKTLLADIPPEVLKAAAFQHIASSKWFPTVAELRELAREITCPARLTGVEAWGVVKREIARVGLSGKPDFGDEFIAAAVRTLGWGSLCMSEFEAADRARFIQCYETFIAREDRQAALLPQVRALMGEVSQVLLPRPSMPIFEEVSDEVDRR